MSKQVKRKFGSSCLLMVDEQKAVLVNSHNKHLVFALSDLEALVELWSKRREAIMESVRAARVVHLRIVLPWDKTGAVTTACGITTKISNENLHWTKRVRNCTCPKCKENLATAKGNDERSSEDSKLE